LKNPQTPLYKTNDLQPNVDTQLAQTSLQFWSLFLKESGITFIARGPDRLVKCIKCLGHFCFFAT